MLYMTNFDLKAQAPWLQHFIRDGEGQSYIYPGMHSVTVGGTRQVKFIRNIIAS